MDKTSNAKEITDKWLTKDGQIVGGQIQEMVEIQLQEAWKLK